MEIKIRKLSVTTVKKIDELARKKGMSREAYLRSLLEDFVSYQIRNGYVDRLEKQIEANNILMAQTVKSIDELVAVVKELIIDDS